MKQSRPKKPDPIACLAVAVTLGMLLTTVAQAQDYLFSSELEKYSHVGQPENVLSLLPQSQHSWLIPKARGMRTTIKGGMAHFEIDSRDEQELSSWLPEQTRIIFSMGIEDNTVGNQRPFEQGDEIFDQYAPRLYMSIGHRW